MIEASDRWGIEAIPTQAKLLAHANMLGVSPHWIRFGTGARKASKASDLVHEDAAVQSGVVVVAEQQAALVPVVERLTRLSPSNVRLVEDIVRRVLAEQGAKR